MHLISLTVARTSLCIHHVAIVTEAAVTASDVLTQLRTPAVVLSAFIDVFMQMDAYTDLSP